MENGQVFSEAPDGEALRTDLIITASDLRVRVTALPGQDEADLNRPRTLELAMALLLNNPETAAVVVVADDDQLSARLLEPTDTPQAIISAGETRAEDFSPTRGPLGKVVRAYLQQVNPGWDDIPVLASSDVNLHAEAEVLATAQLASLRSARKNTPEWRTARNSMGDRDAAWAADLALALRMKEDLDVISKIQLQIRQRKPQ
jgi:hypothetical protein